MRARSLQYVWVVALSACTYITQKEFEEKRDTVDEDGDGSPWSEDCDDLNPERSPRFAEVPYDGIDNDCLDSDVVDMDGDGFPGITSEEYEALDPQVPFPDLLVGKARDCLDDPSVRAEAASIHPPPNDTEISYDGLDSDCDRSNDFDDDGDGWLARRVLLGGVSIDVAAAYAQYVAEWGYEDQEALWAPPGQAAPQPGDCDDFEPEVHPDPVLPEVWYDGIDQDCDDRNDFDQDGDGFMPPLLPSGEPTSGAYDSFVEAYHSDGVPWTVPDAVSRPVGEPLDEYSDCLDDPALAPIPTGEDTPVAPETVYPRPSLAQDPWYDGIDTNCWADNDFDQDLDGFLPKELEVGGQPIDVASAYAGYVASWGYAIYEEDWGAPSGLDAPRPGDCNDLDATTYPQALELVGDQADQDCDGQADAAAFSFADWIWDRPGAPRATRIGDNYIIALTASSVTTETGLLEQVGLALSVRLDQARTGVVPVTVQFKNAFGTDPVGEAVDIALIPNDSDLSGDGVDDPGAWVGTSYTPFSTGLTLLFGRQIYENSSSGSISIGRSIANNPDLVYEPSSVELVVNNAGLPYLMACTDDLLHVLQGDKPLPTDPFLIDTTAGRGDVCFANSDPYASAEDEIVEYTRCSSALCNDYSLALTATSQLQTASNGNTGELWTSGHTHGNLQVLLDGTDLLVRDLFGLDYPLFVGDTVLSGDAMLLGNQLFAVAIVDEGAEHAVRLTYGDPADLLSLQTLDLPFVGAPVPDALPTAVALHVDDDRVMVAVMARDRTSTPAQDAVGWMFLGTP
jgi:hypothetical protein